jgi:DNA-binding response OmpR family regulator
MQHTGKKLLVVEDDPDILQFLQLVLEDEGYDVRVCTKGQDLEQLHKGELPDLILLDIFLSGRDGREIVRELKSQAETRHIPVIMSSAHPKAGPTARAAGADDFLAKPFNIDELLAMVAKYC